jgi:hypothetical protein
MNAPRTEKRPDVTKFKVREQAKQAAYERQQAAMRKQSEDLTHRLLAAYEAESDREYAEEFYGSMLRERGAL